MLNLLVFGDSITWGACDLECGGWVQRLRLEFDRVQMSKSDLWLPVYNLGISGDTSAGVAQRIRNELAVRHDPAEGSIVVLAIGINDSIVVRDPHEPQVTLAQYEENLERIAAEVKRVTDHLLLVGLTPVQQEKLDPLPWNPSKAYRLDRAHEFAQALDQFAAKNKIAIVHIWDDWRQRDLNVLLSDGLHPNAAGHEDIYQRVSRRLKDAGILTPSFRLN